VTVTVTVRIGLGWVRLWVEARRDEGRREGEGVSMSGGGFYSYSYRRAWPPGL